MPKLLIGESYEPIAEGLFTGLNLRVQGHLLINEYSNRLDYQEQKASRVLLNRRNAIHKDNAAIMAIKAITNREAGQITYMVFGNGGTNLDNTGTVTFKTPNVGTGSDLYNPVYFQLVDDSTGALPGNQMNVRHMTNTLFSDVEIRCLIGANQPFGQIGSNTLPTITTPTTILNLGTQHFAFNEIGLKLADGTLVTHVIFVPIVKSASSLLEIVYTIRVAIHGALALPELPKHFALTGQEATASVGTLDFNYRVQSIRFNDSPYLANAPRSLSISPFGTFSVWLRGENIFNMAKDTGPALFSSGYRFTLEVAGRGYIRRNPTAITRTNPCQITIPAHGLSTGDPVRFDHVLGGCSELQGLTETVTVIDADHFTIPVNATGFAAPYTGPALVTFPSADAPIANSLRVIFRNTDASSAASVYYWNSSEQLPLTGWFNLMIAWDMDHPAGQKILQVYVNDTPLASTTDPTWVYDPSAPFSIDYTSAPKWVVADPAYVGNFVNVPQVAREILRSRT